MVDYEYRCIACITLPSSYRRSVLVGGLWERGGCCVEVGGYAGTRSSKERVRYISQQSKKAKCQMWQKNRLLDSLILLVVPRSLLVFYHFRLLSVPTRFRTREKPKTWRLYNFDKFCVNRQAIRTAVLDVEKYCVSIYYVLGLDVTSL